jgi:hypothetical protein
LFHIGNIKRVVAGLIRQLEAKMTYEEACAKIPRDALLTCTFGYPNEGGYTEFWWTPAGRRWEVSNGPWFAMWPFDWTCKEVTMQLTGKAQ